MTDEINRAKTIQEILDFIEDLSTERTGWGNDVIDTSFDTLPGEYISFAEFDIESEFKHKYINALSNAKRALDCQADRLLKSIGYYRISKKKFWGFSKKIEFIKKLNILTPRILKKINRLRNLMEHEYIKPNEEQVEDFIDVVSLFIASTDKFVSSPRDEVIYTNDNLELAEITVKLNVDNGLIKIIDIEDPIAEIRIVEDYYIEFMKRHLNKISIM